MLWFCCTDSQSFLCSLETADVPPGVALSKSELHTSTVSESSVKCYPVRAYAGGPEFGSLWERQRDTARHVYCLGQLMPAQCTGQS